MPKITAELLEKLESWRRAGDRCIKLEQNQRDKEWSVWIYDYEIMSGMYLKEGDFNKDWDVMILTDKRDSLRRDLNDLDKKLGGVA